MRSVIPFITVLSTAALLWVGCAEDGSDCAVECQNGGTCMDDVCDCPAGFTGTSCETELRADLIGDYIVDDNCTPGTSYVISITGNSQSGLALDVSNIGNHGFTVLATIDEEEPYIFNFSAQSVTIGGSPATISGSGTYQGGSQFYMNYVTLINGTSTTCNVQ